MRDKHVQIVDAATLYGHNAPPSVGFLEGMVGFVLVFLAFSPWGLIAVTVVIIAAIGFAFAGLVEIGKILLRPLLLLLAFAASKLRTGVLGIGD